MLVCPKCGSTFTRALEFCGLDGARLVESAVDPLLGRTLERYAISSMLGSGGMARVYRARHVYLEQDFALKVLNGELAQDKGLARRFEREARALSRIKHPSVVTVTDFGISKEGLLFMVMELLEGPTLSAELRQAGPLEPARAATIIKHVALGLGAAHERGFVHRDLKPGNVMLTRSSAGEQAKILDFGLVRMLTPDPGDPQLTLEGMMFGTPTYMSPEQFQGAEAGPAADLYALGVILYQLLTGTPPFQGTVEELAIHHLKHPPPPLRLSYSGLAELAMALMQKEPADRPQSAAGVAKRIDELAVSTRISQRPQAVERTSSRPRKSSLPRPADSDSFPALSRPVLAEERTQLTQLGATTPGLDDDAVREALGPRWQPWAIAGLVAALGAGGYFAVQRGWLPPNATEIEVAPEEPVVATPNVPSFVADGGIKTVAPPTKAVAPPTKTVAPPTKAEPAPRDAGVGRDAAVRDADARPRPDAATEIEVPYVIVPDEVAHERSFAELDHALGWALTEKRLSWSDLAMLAPEDAKNWGRWYRNQGEPPAQILLQTFDALIRAIEAARIDRTFLEAKAKRVKKALDSIPRHGRNDRYDALVIRLGEINKTLQPEPLRRAPDTISQDLSVLEADILNHANEVKQAPATQTSTTD